MPNNSNPTTVFARNPNPLISFVILGWNKIALLTRKKVGTAIVIAVLLFVILIPLSMDFPNWEYMQFLLIISPIFVITGFPVYVYWLFVSPIYSVKRIEFFDEKDGFELLKKNGIRTFISYKDINSMQCEFDQFIRIYEAHFLIAFKNSEGKKEEILLSLDITKIYDALDRIVHHIPKEKWGNIRVIDGKVTMST